MLAQEHQGPVLPVGQRKKPCSFFQCSLWDKGRSCRAGQTGWGEGRVLKGLHGGTPLYRLPGRWGQA